MSPAVYIKVVHANRQTDRQTDRHYSARKFTAVPDNQQCPTVPAVPEGNSSARQYRLVSDCTSSARKYRLALYSTISARKYRLVLGSTISAYSYVVPDSTSSVTPDQLSLTVPAVPYHTSCHRQYKQCHTIPAVTDSTSSAIPYQLSQTVPAVSHQTSCH